MAFLISKSQPSFSDSEPQRDETQPMSSVTSQLYLMSSSPNRTSGSESPLDRDVVLRRLRRHKCLKKIQNTFQPLIDRATSSQQQQAQPEQRWLEPIDAFSAP